MFSEVDAHGLEVRLNDAIIVSVCIGHGEVRRVLIDNESSSDILSLRMFGQLGLQRKDFTTTENPPQGFAGSEKVIMVTYAITAKFLTEAGVGVMKSSQEWVREANLSVHREKAESEVMQIDLLDEDCPKVDQEKAKAETLTKVDLDPRETSLKLGKDQVEEPTIEVILDEGIPDQTVKLETQLSYRIQSNMTLLLKEFKDVFTWKH
ncbi:hypothetical protein Dsin_032827 [Dipteronia sinensis]|uniref:Uncharacterized protein n=1 Tax=Dipteronia sinensis TaxID=43782 RepID=A0AAD9ZI55_9ROSI|nr:hypothetical protein Dsin_032827 [Dipteronia sinensis]